MTPKFDSLFAAAYIDNGNKYRFFGVRVRPFSLWHLMLLRVSDSPFIKAGNADLHDLKNAIAICRLEYRQSRIRRPLWPITVGGKRLRKEIAKFLSYIGDYLSKPEYSIVPTEISPSSKPRPPINSPPDLISLAYNASQGARVSIGEAWNMPIGEACISQAMYFINQGLQVDFMNDADREFQEEMKKSGLKPGA